MDVSSVCTAAEARLALPACAQSVRPPLVAKKGEEQGERGTGKGTPPVSELCGHSRAYAITCQLPAAAPAAEHQARLPALPASSAPAVVPKRSALRPAAHQRSLRTDPASLSACTLTQALEKRLRPEYYYKEEKMLSCIAAPPATSLVAPVAVRRHRSLNLSPPGIGPSRHGRSARPSRRPAAGG